MKAYKGIVICLLLLVSACSSTSNSRQQITNAVTNYIEHEKTIVKNTIFPISDIYLRECELPLPPTDRDMLAYEIALRDAIISFKECIDKHTVLVLEVHKQNDNILKRK